MKKIIVELGDNDDLSRMRLKLEQCLIQNNCTYKMTIENVGFNNKNTEKVLNRLKSEMAEYTKKYHPNVTKIVKEN